MTRAGGSAWAEGRERAVPVSVEDWVLAEGVLAEGALAA